MSFTPRNKHAHKRNKDPDTLVEDAHALVTVTANIAEEKVAEARRRLAEALNSAKALAGRTRDQALDYAKTTDEAMHQHPYQATGIAFGIGLLLGCLLMCQRSRGSD
jgi:ElaB/YqjD/DUF883 family membrane-anchored ribosome-binding protein